MPTNRAPRHRPLQPPPSQHASVPPKVRPVGKVPNPRRPNLVPDIHGNELGDMFLFFPDLPWPPRPAARLPIRRLRRR